MDLPAGHLVQACFAQLPDIGAQKCGTSSLFSYLSQHPQLHPSFKKEVHYFDGGARAVLDNYRKGDAWYRSHFPLVRQLTAESRTFEATPRYLYDPLAAGRIRDLIPNAKLIAILRNPTERAISHYFHALRSGRETLPIQDALLCEWPESGSDNCQSDTNVLRGRYKTAGLYAQQIAAFFSRFPRQQLLVLKSEDLFARPLPVLREIFQFV